jgi:Mrp family chromosome partitioning ATPase
LLRELRLEFNIIVVDLPHVLGHPHAAILASLMVGVLLVVEGERDRRPWMAASKKQLEDAGANLIGAVLNKRRQYLPSFISRWF